MPDDDVETIQPGQPSPAGVYAPSSVYLTGEENLRVTAYSNTANVVLAIVGRILRPDNTPTPIADSIAPGNTRAATTKIIPLSEGWLLGVAVEPGAGVTPIGATYVMLELVRGTGSNAQSCQVLGFGYVNLRNGFAWPDIDTMLPTDGPGVMRSVQQANPAAGADFVVTVPTGALWELIAVSAQLVTAVAVANRAARLVIDDGANTLFAVPNTTVQAASLTTTYSYGAGAGGPMSTDAAFQEAPLPNNVLLPAASRIRSSTGAIQAADQWGAISLLVREWLAGL